MWKALFYKLKEALSSVLPVGIIVLILSLTPLVTLTGREMTVFGISALLLIVGIALFNLGALMLDDKRPDAALAYFDAIRNPDADVQNAKGVVELQRGDLPAAAEFFRKANTEEAKANLGLVELLQGDYASAAGRLKGTKGVNGAIAYLLDGKLDEAEAAINCNCGRSEYVRAVIAARRGDAAGVKSHLDALSQKDKRLYEQAQKDVEFAKYK